MCEERQGQDKLDARHAHDKRGPEAERDTHVQGTRLLSAHLICLAWCLLIYIAWIIQTKRPHVISAHDGAHNGADKRTVRQNSAK